VTPRFYIRLRRSVSLVESSEIDCYRTYPHFSVAYRERETKSVKQVALSDRKRRCRKPSLAAVLCQSLSE